jgi:hypothetical protein
MRNEVKDLSDAGGTQLLKWAGTSVLRQLERFSLFFQLSSGQHIQKYIHC